VSSVASAGGATNRIAEAIALSIPMMRPSIGFVNRLPGDGS
jgi:hypothetical protein